MPNYYDFSKVSNIKKVEVKPNGWVQPLYVEYGESYIGNTPSYFWRVVGTNHTFTIPMIRMQYLSSGNYVKHFEETLEAFREDYKDWAEENFYTEWMQEYRRNFKSFISL